MKAVLIAFIYTSILSMVYGIGCKDTDLTLDALVMVIYSTLFLLIIEKVKS